MAFGRSGANQNEDTKQYEAHVTHWKDWRRGYPKVPIILRSEKKSRQISEIFPQVVDNYIHAVYIQDRKKGGPFVIWHSKDNTVLRYDSKNLGFLDERQLLTEYPWAYDVPDKSTYHMRTLYAEEVTGLKESDRRMFLGTWFHDKAQNSILTHLVYNPSKGKVVVRATIAFEKNTPGYGQTLCNTLCFLEPERGSAKGLKYDQFIVGFYRIWAIYDIEKDRPGYISRDVEVDHRMSNDLLGCTPLLCFDADLDAITDLPSGHIMMFRNFNLVFAQALHFDRQVQESYDMWDVLNIKDGYVDAAVTLADRMYIFKQGYFFECPLLNTTSSRTGIITPVANIKCQQKGSIRGFFRDYPETFVDAAMIDAEGQLLLFHGRQFSVFKFTSPTEVHLVSTEWVYFTYEFLPAMVDAIYAPDPKKEIIFFRSNFFWRNTEKKPMLTQEHFFECLDGGYNDLGAYAGINTRKDFIAWRKKFIPPAAKRPTEEEQNSGKPSDNNEPGAPQKEEKKKKFNWLWLLLLIPLLLLLLLLLWLCLRKKKNPSKTKHHKSHPKSKAPSGAPSAAGPSEGDLRSKYSGTSRVPEESPSMRSNMTAVRTNIGSDASKRSKMSDLHSGTSGAKP